jgi:quercetin dioxygenase-like cupin family protein
MKRVITAGVIGALAVAGIAASAPAMGPADPHTSAGGHGSQPGVTIEPLASATILEKVRDQSAGINLRTDGRKAMLTASITVEPGGSFGWHSHPGPVFVAVTKGAFTLHQVENQRCRRRVFGPGDAFVEDGERVHLGVNEGSEPVRIFATFLAREGTTRFSQDESPPGACR